LARCRTDRGGLVMDANAILLTTLRGLHLLALLVLIGSLVSLVAVIPSRVRTVTPAPERSNDLIALARLRVLRMARIAAVATLLTGAAWLVMQAVTIGNATGPAQALAVLWLVVRGTRFGQVVLIRLALIALAVPLLRPWRGALWTALLLAVLSAMMQGVLGHAGAVDDALTNRLVGAEALHLAAMGAWLGGLPALFVLVGTLPPPDARRAWRRFSIIAIAAVIVLTVSALMLTVTLLGDLPRLLGTTYGHVALLKLALFLPLLALAAGHFAVLHRTATPDAAARPRILRLMAAETALGVAMVLAAGFLASQVPAFQDQSVWPFAWRPSLVAIADPALRHEVAGALVSIAAAVAIAVAGLALRRTRWLRGTRVPAGWLAVAVAAVIVWQAAPHLDLLLVEAYPTSYATSPTGFTADSIARGATLFAANCTSCHGATGRGDGTRAAALPVQPADLTAPHLWEHSDGELFWWLSHGIDAPEEGSQDGVLEAPLAMPGFAATLSADDRWALIDYIRANNAGRSMTEQGTWPAPLQAPSVAIVCGRATGVDTDHLRGQVLRVIAGMEAETAPASSPIPAQAGVSTITLWLTPDGRNARTDGRIGLPAPGDCISATPAAWVAYAAIAGVAPAALGGTEFLVDPDGWLRALWRPDSPGGWRTPDQLLAEIRRICSHPVATLTHLPR
jgi:putative copper export protein/mono/diheme cytochrome c family protein